MSDNGHFKVPTPYNEPVRTYEPGTPHRFSVRQRLAQMTDVSAEIPMTIGGDRRKGASTKSLRSPHRHELTIGEYQVGAKTDFQDAIDAALMAQKSWSATPFQERAAILLRAAALLAGPWRDSVNAATMLGQSKTIHQAEIDAACELIDFWRFNVFFADQLLAIQPFNDSTAWNRTEYRPLEGFVYAVSPFNFTSIGGNLPTAPPLLGNTVVYKPATQTLLVASLLQRLLEEAGLPAGVINLVSGRASAGAAVVLNDPHLAGIHFTGSTEVFQGMWQTVGANIGRYRSYPRLIGENGGQGFVRAHDTAAPVFRLLKEDLFGPILTVHPYPDGKWEETLDLCDRTSPYALTGAVFANDRSAIEQASERLVNAAGNFYINGKPTGAVVGLQPFGGGRASGTNDKAGSLLNLVRWTSPRTIKETYNPAKAYRYPFMDEPTEREGGF